MGSNPTGTAKKTPAQAGVFCVRGLLLPTFGRRVFAAATINRSVTSGVAGGGFNGTSETRFALDGGRTSRIMITH